MFPYHIKLGPLSLGLDQLSVFIGIITGVLVFRKRLIGLGVTWSDLFDFILAGLVGGAVGAKLMYVIPLWIRGAQSMGSLVSGWSGGSAFYGGMIGGGLLCMAVAWKKKKPVGEVMDVFALGVPIGFAIGKVGCFLTGCCYGARCSSPPGIAFPKGSLAWTTQREAGQIPKEAVASLPVHPVPLYDIAFALVLFALMYKVYHKSKRPGETALLWVIGYSLYRFAIEFLRDDPERHVFGISMFTDSQIVALILIPATIVTGVFLKPTSAGQSDRT